MIKVLYFARLREQMGQAGDQVELDDALHTLEDVRHRLVTLNPAKAETLQARDLLVARNQEMVSWQTVVADGDEVALFPPVTGG